MNKYVVTVSLLVIVVLAGLYLLAKNNTPQEISYSPSPTYLEPTTTESLAQIFAEKYNKSIKDINVGVSVDDGKFAKGSVNFADEPGGGIWFAAKQDGEWKLAFDGNGIITCVAADTYNFPVGLVPSCIDSSNDNALIQR